MTVTDDSLHLPEGLLAELERVGQVGAPSEQLLLDTRVALRRAATTETLRGDVRRLRRRRRLAGRTLVGVAAVVAVLAVVGVVGPGAHSPVSPAAASVLSSAADRLAAVPTPGPGGYLHVRTVTTSLDADGSAPRVDVQETWVPADDAAPGLDRATPGDGKPTTDGLLLPRTTVVHDPHPREAFYQAHPTGREPMLAALRRLTSDLGDHGHADDEEVWGTAVGLVLDNQAPLDLKSDVIRAVSDLPGVDIVARGLRIDGRAGLAIGLPSDPRAPWLVFDRTSQTYLGSVGHPAHGPDWVGPEQPTWTTVTSYSVSATAPWTRETAAQARSYGLEVRVPQP